MKKFNQFVVDVSEIKHLSESEQVNEYAITGPSRQSYIGSKQTCPECDKSKPKSDFKKFGDKEVCKSCHSDLSVAKRERYFAGKATNEQKDQLDEISKQTAQKYLNKTVDPDLGLPKAGYKNLKTRMKGIKRASKIVASEQMTDSSKKDYDAEKGRANMKKLLADRQAARAKVDALFQELRRKKEQQDKQ